MMLRSALAWERIGERWFPRFAGVAMIEASKEIYAAKPKPAAALSTLSRVDAEIF